MAVVFPCWTVMSWQLIQGVTPASRQLGPAPATTCLQPCRENVAGGRTDGRCVHFSPLSVSTFHQQEGHPYDAGTDPTFSLLLVLLVGFFDRLVLP